MSKIALNSNASGTGVFTIASPNSDTDRTFDLPDGAGTIAVASQLDNHNLIINGDGGVNQRSYTSGTATTGANEYTLDRWRVVTSGESLTFTGNEAGRTMTAPSGGVEQVIEGLNIAGGTYVITWTGTATGAVDGTTVSSGDTVTLTANTNATVKFTSGTFTNVKVEEGSIATPFRKRSFNEELLLCQRYYEKSFAYATTPAQGLSAPVDSYGFNGLTTYNTIHGRTRQYTFVVEKRAGPSITIYRANNTAVDGRFGYYNGSWIAPSAVTTYASSKHCAFQLTGSYTAYVTYLIAGGFAADAEL